MAGIIMLVLYLLGAVGVFAYHATIKEYEFEMTIFFAVFYPLILLMWSIMLVLAIVMGAMHALGEAIRMWKVRKKNGK